MDNRAQSIAVARFILALVGGAFIVWIVNEVSSPLFEYSREASNSAQATAATGWLETGVGYMALAFLLISFFGLIVVNIYGREVLR